jgi:hypothetical protein
MMGKEESWDNERLEKAKKKTGTITVHPLFQHSNIPKGFLCSNGCGISSLKS